MKAKPMLVLALLLGTLAPAQTKLDLQRQANRVDFSAADFTRPVKAGTAPPSSCLPGELYFKTNAATAGSNLLGCTGAGNTWTVLGAPSTTGTFTFQIKGSTVGTRSVHNVMPGAGIINTAFDSGSAIVTQYSIDTAYVTTRPIEQSGASLLCGSSSASASAYTCAMSPTLTAYTTGMVLHWIPDVNATGGATTLNIDGLGSKLLLLEDGSQPTSADITAGTLYGVWYDGAAFRLRSNSALTAVQSARPTCSASLRGRLWLTPGASGVKDLVAVCAKDAANTYDWRPIY